MGRFQILPAEDKFYDWFEKGGANLLEAAQLLDEMVDQLDRATTKVVAISETERKGDFITHEIHDLLRKTLITPLDQEETQGLAASIDDAVDMIDRAANRLVLYRVEQSTDEANGLCDIIIRCAEEVKTALPLLRDRKTLPTVTGHVIEINRLEREADVLYRRALENLITSSRDDWFEFIRWKDIYDNLEAVTNRCEDIADVLHTVVLKNA